MNKDFVRWQCQGPPGGFSPSYDPKGGDLSTGAGDLGYIRS